MLLVSTMRIRNAGKYVEEAQPCEGVLPVNEANQLRLYCCVLSVVWTLRNC